MDFAVEFLTRAAEVDVAVVFVTDPSGADRMHMKVLTDALGSDAEALRTELLTVDKDVRNGFDGIKVDFKIDADASQDDIKALVAQSQKRSAVFDIVTNPTNVFVSVNS